MHLFSQNVIDTYPGDGLLNLGRVIRPLLGTDINYKKCPGTLPDFIVDCVPIYMYETPCLGMTWSGRPVPPCIGNSNPSGSSYNTNANTNNNTNNIVINVTAENRVEIEKPDKQ